MTEGGSDILRKTWSRAIEPLNKLGYMDGATDGQTAGFQSSFDMGYKQGFNFGLQLGLNGSNSSQVIDSWDLTVRDQRRINCQICTNSTTQDDVTNLFNIQEEKNVALLKTIR